MEFDLLRLFPIFGWFYPFEGTRDMAMYLVLSAFTNNSLSLLANTKVFVFSYSFDTSVQNINIISIN